MEVYLKEITCLSLTYQHGFCPDGSVLSNLVYYLKHMNLLVSFPSEVPII